MAKQKKNWARRGRPRSTEPRTPSGQVSRAAREDVRAVGLAYRENHYGLTPDQASHEKACTALGRAYLRRYITEEQLRAGERYLELKNAELNAIKAPAGLAKGGTGGTGGDLVTDEYIEWAIRAVAVYEVAKAWLDDIELRAVVDAVALDDHECDEVTAPYLRRALAHLVKRMGIDQMVAA